jgi:GAF domain-containing protein/CheY-like chemotaxis protein
MTLSGLTRLMTSAAERDEVFQAVAEAATRLLGAAASRVWIDDSMAGVLRTQGTFGIDRDLEAVLTDFPSIPHGEGLVGRIFVSQTPEYLPDIAEDPRYLNRRLATEGGFHGFAGLPLITGDRVVGVLAVLFRGPRRFTAEDRALIELLADAAAIAINTARLLENERLGRAHLAGVLEINKTIGTVRSPETLLNLIAEEAARLLGVDNAGFRLLEGNELVLAGLAGSAQETMLRPRIQVGESLSGKVIAERRSLILDISRVPDVVPEHWAADQRLGYSAYLGVPVQLGSRLLGVLAFRARRSFTARDQALAEALAGQAAIAIEHASLNRASRQQAERMKALADLGRALSETLAVETVAQRVGQSIRALLGAYSSALYRLEPDTGDLVAVGVAEDVAAVLGSTIVFPRGTGVAGVAVAQRQPIATPNLLVDQRVTLPAALRARITQGPYRSVLAVPLRVQDRVIGALAVGDREGRLFTDDEIALAQAFADHAALVLENARLYQDVQQAYEDLSRTQAHLVRAGTLQATGELAAGAAHHLNNLLQVALTRIQLFRQASQTPEVRRHFEPAEQALRDSAEVVRRLSAFSRAHPVHQPVSVDLNRVAAEVIELTRARWQDEAQLRGAQIDVRLQDGTIPCVSGDPASLREVLVNLVLNAVDAMPRGGPIVISTWATAVGVFCSVSDTGLGMSPDIQRRALEPFFTTKGVRNTGLGLSVNYGIIQRHGGELTLESAEGHGTTITFRLPPEAASDRQPQPVEPQGVTPRRILLVDDDPNVRKSVAEVLAEDGHTVTEAESGADARAHLASGQPVDLVLTDLGMPGMTGWDVARAVKASHRSIPVGLITGWGPNPKGTPEERAAVDFILAKPVTEDTLRACLAQVLLPQETDSPEKR